MLLSSSNRKYPPFTLLSYIPWLCAWDVCYITFCHLLHIRENRECVFIIIVQFMMSANIRILFGLQIVLVCLYSTPSHYHHCSNLSEGIELIKCLSDILCRVWVRLSIFSPLSSIQYVGLCAFSLPIHFVMIERMHILCLIIIIKSEVWTLTHCLGLGHEAMVCAVCLSIFFHMIFQTKMIVIATVSSITTAVKN